MPRTKDTSDHLTLVQAVEDGQRPQVIAFEESATKRWDSFVLAHAGGSFFHQIGWKRVMEDTYGYRPFYFYTERAGEITGIAPAFLVSNWLRGRCLISLPFAVYGGICANDVPSEKALQDHMERTATALGIECLELRNRSGDLLEGYHANSRYATFTLALTPDTDSLYEGFPKGIRYMIRKGEKAGLTVRRGFEQMNDFYRLMTLNLARLGTPAFPRSLFGNLVAEYPNQVDLMLAYAGDEPVAGAMSFIFRDSLQPYYFGSSENAKGLAANNFLWWHLMKFAAASGLRTFDFGRSKMNSGNYDFKAKWNPQIEPLRYQVRLFGRRGVPDFSPANPKFELATSVWKRLPLGWTRRIGPRVVRWFP